MSFDWLNDKETDEVREYFTSRFGLPPETLGDTSLCQRGDTIFALKKEVEKCNKFIGRLQAHFARQQERQAKQQLMQMQNNIGSMCSVIKQSTSAPISRIDCGSRKGDETAKQH